jgi:hypothetical protein
MICRGQQAYAVAPRWDALRDGPASGSEHHAIILDGRPSQIYELNRRLGDTKQITEQTATDYLCFFCKFVHVEGGALLVLKSPDDLDWMDFPVVEPERKRIVGASIVPPSADVDSIGRQPPAPNAQADETKFSRLVTICYDGDLFLASFEIMATGYVALEEEHLLIRNLPVRAFSFGKDQYPLFYEMRE